MTEEDLLRWADGLLKDERLEAVNKHLQTQPALRAELENSRLVGAALREEIPAHIEPPYHDFFNTRIMRAVRDEQMSQYAEISAKPSLFEKLRWLVLPITAGALALAFVAGMNMSPVASGGPKPLARIESAEEQPSVYLPSTSLQANVVAGVDRDVNLIVLDGLKDIPDDVNFSLSTVDEKPATYSVVKFTDDDLL